MRLRIERVRHPPIFAALHAACFDAPWPEDTFARLLALPTTFGLVAAAPEPAGFALVQIAADEAEVLAMGVVPARRRAGVGRALLADAAGAARAAGAAALFLEVRADNAAAQALYRCAGFAIAGRRAGYYRDAQGAHDAIVMRLAL
ncbi:MAG: ribosomal-protein-alanine N-acetyltransferase [Alphaproteobacteria bacterium]|nr:ribosomal-protein-alanine N-acetyltransferase [Alphaproteobacteria bacterium]